MNKRIKALQNKIKNNGGESIAETLVASLIGGLALLTLAQMLTSASVMIRNSQDTMNKYISSENDMNKSGELPDGSEVTKGTDTIVFKENGTQEKNIASKDKLNVTTYKNGDVVRYE